MNGNRDFLNLAATDVKAAVEQYKAQQKTYEVNSSTMEEAKIYIDKQRMSIKDFAALIGVSRPLMSQYLNNKYSLDTTEIEKKIIDYFKKVDYFAAEQNSKKKLKVFLPSSDALNILGICGSCQEQKGLGVIVGQSGFGKTYTLKKYAEKERVAYVECDDGMGTKDMVEAIEKALGLPLGFSTIWKRVDTIKEFFKVNRGYLLIIDEADKLVNRNTQKKAEIVRAIFDQSEVGIVLAGEPALEGRIRGYIPRLSNRVDFFYKLEGINKQEVKEYLNGFCLTNDAFEEIYKRAVNSYTGCFRLLDRTVRNITRIIESNVENDEIITLDIINKASSMMMM